MQISFCCRHYSILKSSFLGYCLLYFNILYSQSTFDTFPDVPNLDNQAQAWSLHCEDQGFYVLGDLIDISGNVVPWLGYIDYNGYTQNSFIINDTTHSNSFRVGSNEFYKNSENKFFIYGSQRNDNGVVKPKLTEIDPLDGKIVRSSFLNNPIDSTENLIRKAIILKNDLIILTSYYWTNNHYNYYVVVLDDNLQLINDFVISDQINNNVVFKVICESDSTITLIGDSRLASDQSNLPDIKPFIYRLSLKGDSLYFKIFEEFNERAIAFGLADVHSVQKDNYNNWIISCLSIVENTNCFNCFYHVPYTFALDSNFVELKWLHTFMDLTPNLNSQPLITAMIKCSDESGFITAGFDTYSFIYKVNNFGDTLWLRKYIPINWDTERALWTEFVDLKETPAGNLLMCGRVSDRELGIIRPWIVQVDKYGCLIPGCQLTNSLYEVDGETRKYFSIYPNPSSQELFLFSSSPTEVYISLKVIATDGTILKSKEFYNSQGTHYLFTIEDIPTGTYYIVISDEGKSIFESHTFIKE